MNLQVPLHHRINNSRILQKHTDAPSDVQIDHLESAVLLIEAFEQLSIGETEVSEWHEPGVYEAKFLVVKGCSDTATASVAADDDVLDFEVLDSVLDNREGVDVGGDEDVGDVSVAEDVTGLKA